MQNRTTSYGSRTNRRYQPKPQYRRNTGNQLPNGRRRQQRRRGNTYLKRSQGFGGRRRPTRGLGQSHDPRRVYALIIVGCALLLFAASILWYANRSVDITLNGETASVRIHSSIDRVISDEELDLNPGNLLAVDDSVLRKGEGTAYTVKLNGKDIAQDDIAAIELTGGEELEILDGEDVYEEHEVQATEIQPELTVKGTGPLRFVETWGVAGRSEVWIGNETGKTVDKGVVQEPVDCLVTCTSVTPDKDDSKYVAITFDEGPSSRTDEIVDILNEKGAKATFFVSGDKIADNSSAVKAIVESGNELGTNGYSDTSFTSLSASDLRSQLTSSFDAVEQAAGTRVSLVRPPYGEFSEQNWADGMDLVSAVVAWNVDSGDWLLPGAQTVVDTVVGAAGNGSIVLLTDNESTADQTIEALPKIIDALQENGFTLVTVSELIATDEDLADLVATDKVAMPENAVLPRVVQETATGEDSE